MLVANRSPLCPRGYRRGAHTPNYSRLIQALVGLALTGALLILVYVFTIARINVPTVSGYWSSSVAGSSGQRPGSPVRLSVDIRDRSHLPRTLISYSYFEKDEMQSSNLMFFLRQLTKHTDSGDVHSVFTVSGPECKPCPALITGFHLKMQGGASFYQGTVTEVQRGSSVTLLRRQENVGMDFGNHNITLEWIMAQSLAWFTNFKYFVFLNSSVRGPFLPTYFEATMHWSQAFTSLLTDEIKLVGSSLVCLPATDAGGPGPRMESFVFATDQIGRQRLSDTGVLNIWNEKYDIIVNGEYGLTKSLFEAGYNVATLLYKYDFKTDWRNSENWGCNNQVHPSRDCSYDGISQHPFETVFIKSSWGVSTDIMEKYSHWADDKLRGNSTHGSFDEVKYLRAIRHEPLCPSLWKP